MKTVMPIFSHCVAMLLIGFSCIAFDSHADNGLVPFSFANPQVNHALIRLYEQQTSIWQKDQLYLVGLCYIAEKELDKAQELFEKLRDQGSTNINVLQTLGSLYHMKGKSTEAAKLYQQVWHQSKDVDALRQLAVLKLQVKDI